ncbi:MAG: hypothetical protein F6J87_11970 [Spirulina sp. SIO3F2]|nr:hypothetical protein [Spirulina sp. SIO3F2]
MNAPTTQRQIPGRRHAIVLGASMAGLLAARVLSDHFESVTLVERDYFPEATASRRGVPQDRHLHVLLVKGEQILNQLFPKMGQDLQQLGIDRLDLPGDVYWFQGGGYKHRDPSGLSLLCMSRPYLEGYVRQQVLHIKNLVCRQGTEIRGLISSPDRTRITGVQIQERGAAHLTSLTADLVIDATGRQSKSPQWLEALGYPKPQTSIIPVNVSYTTRLYQQNARLLSDAKGICTLPVPPEGRRSGGLLPVEGNRWIVTLIGWLGDYAPTDESGFLDYAQSLPNPDIYNVIRSAQPLTDSVMHKFPANCRHHYERLSRFPQGYLVMGDALCSPNPIYGQGMTMSALAAQALDRCLQTQPNSSHNLAPSFFKAAARAIENPWRLSVSEDFRFPGVTGPKPFGTNLLNRYASQLHQTTLWDAQSTHAFFAVLTLTQAPRTLFHPQILWRVFKHWLSQLVYG